MRLSRELITRAGRVDRLLPLLLPTLRTIPDAQRELEWLKRELPAHKLYRACYLRGKGVPLQYILGSQPFGDLDIKCARGVLIPRWETEEWTIRLASLLRHQQLLEKEANQNEKPLTIVDFCTGTGCIPLSLVSRLRNTSAYGVDISRRAIQIFKSNIRKHSRQLNLNYRNCSITPVLGDISIDDPVEFSQISGITHADLITANPPYIGIKEFYRTDRSVRLYEPHTALLGGLEFYRWIFRKASYLKAKAIVCEVGNMQQIDYTRQLGVEEGWSSTSYHDLNGQPRAIVLWNDPSWDFLSHF